MKLNYVDAVSLGGVAYLVPTGFIKEIRSLAKEHLDEKIVKQLEAQIDAMHFSKDIKEKMDNDIECIIAHCELLEVLNVFIKHTFPQDANEKLNSHPLNLCFFTTFEIN